MKQSRISVKQQKSILASGNDEKQQSIIFDAFVSKIYLPYVKLRKRSWHIDERIALQHISPYFGDHPVAQIAQSEVEIWHNGLLAGGLAPASCNRYLAVFKSICSLAEIRGYIQKAQSPCKNVSLFKIHKQRERFLSKSEAKLLMEILENSKRQEAKVIQLLLLTGARKSEILNATWENVNLEEHILTVPLSKSGKPRHIVLSHAVLAIIRNLPKIAGCKWLFPGRRPDKPLSDIYLFWNKLRKKLNLADVRIHDLRHTFASFLVNTGHSLYEVQKILGHTDPRTTMRYAHLDKESLLAAAETVSSIFIKDTKKRRSRADQDNVFLLHHIQN